MTVIIIHIMVMRHNNVHSKPSGILGAKGLLVKGTKKKRSPLEKS